MRSRRRRDSAASSSSHGCTTATTQPSVTSSVTVAQPDAAIDSRRRHAIAQHATIDSTSTALSRPVQRFGLTAAAQRQTEQVGHADGRHHLALRAQVGDVQSERDQARAAHDPLPRRSCQTRPASSVSAPARGSPAQSGSAPRRTPSSAVAAMKAAPRAHLPSSTTPQPTADRPQASSWRVALAAEPALEPSSVVVAGVFCGKPPRLTPRPIRSSNAPAARARSGR